MRLAEAHVTRGVIAARQGDLELAVDEGARALDSQRKSLPSLLMVSRDLTHILKSRYPSEPETESYLARLNAISRS